MSARGLCESCQRHRPLRVHLLPDDGGNGCMPFALCGDCEPIPLVPAEHVDVPMFDLGGDGVLVGTEQGASWLGF